MSLDINQKNNSTPKKDYGRVPDDQYPARVVQIIDLGRQHEVFWKDNKPLYYIHDEDGKRVDSANNTSTDPSSDDPVIKPKAWVVFEFVTEQIDVNGEMKNRWYSKEMTISNHEKSGMAKMIEACAPGAKRLSDLLGKPCLVEIGSTGSGKAKVKSVSKLPKMMGSIPELQSETTLLDLDNPDLEVFNKLPDFLKDKIKNGEDFGKSKLKKMLDSAPAKGVESKPKSGGTPVEDDRPF